MENSNEKEDMRALIMVFVIWLLLWCVDNRQYFFEYLPHHSDYEIVAAYKAFNGDMRDNIIRVYVPDRDNAIGYIKADYKDKEEKPIYVGYSKERSPHVVRKIPALSKGMIIAGGIIPAAIVQYFFRKKHK